jgi:hypothetical protein
MTGFNVIDNSNIFDVFVPSTMVTSTHATKMFDRTGRGKIHPACIDPATGTTRQNAPTIIGVSVASQLINTPTSDEDKKQMLARVRTESVHHIYTLAEVSDLPVVSFPYHRFHLSEEEIAAMEHGSRFYRNVNPLLMLIFMLTSKKIHKPVAGSKPPMLNSFESVLITDAQAQSEGISANLLSNLAKSAARLNKSAVMHFCDSLGTCRGAGNRGPFNVLHTSVGSGVYNVPQAKIIKAFNESLYEVMQADPLTRVIDTSGTSSNFPFRFCFGIKLVETSANVVKKGGEVESVKSLKARKVGPIITIIDDRSAPIEDGFLAVGNFFSRLLPSA